MIVLPKLNLFKIERQSGFTIIELMIVIVILGILTAMAIPTYNNYQIRQNREAARHLLNEATNSMERYYLLHGRYIDDEGNPPANIFESQVFGNSGRVYTLTISKNNISSQSFSVSAIPQADSIQDGDGMMCINQQGTIKSSADCN